MQRVTSLFIIPFYAKLDLDVWMLYLIDLKIL